ncbi:MAG: glyceraldehyde 3-phosphate dehydrogenase NAD-binding domain-containing protein [Pseudomonadales bacterium]
MKHIRIGIMGFGRIGRQLYKLAQEHERFDVVAISDIGQPEILHHLLTKTLDRSGQVRLEGNYLVDKHGSRTRLMPANHPTEIPWDVFDVDLVIDATGRFRSKPELMPHLQNGARRVISSVLPDDGMDRVVLYGVNDQEASVDDKVISAGSATTTATALAVQTLTEARAIDQVSMTSIHEYTSDQSLRDYAGPDYRRSRSGAENIIPNTSPARTWVQRLVPAVDGKFSSYAMNVPVPVGSLLDLTVVFKDPVDVATVNALFETAARNQPRLIATTSALIVSSDVKGSPQSLLVDLQGTICTGRMVKILGWHETLGHASRILDVAALYDDLDAEHGTGRHTERHQEAS